MSEPTYVDEVNAITQTLHHYIEGARTGKGAAMKPAFHDGATIYGYVGDDLFGGPIQGLFDWNDNNGEGPRCGDAQLATTGGDGRRPRTRR